MKIHPFLCPKVIKNNNEHTIYIGEIYVKKISGMIGTMALIMFSFYYTDRAIDIVRKQILL